jgi:hypothetical protein
MNNFNAELENYERIHFQICQDFGTHLKIVSVDNIDTTKKVQYIITGLRLSDGTLDELYMPKDLKECNDIIFYCIENNIPYKSYKERKK